MLFSWELSSQEWFGVAGCPCWQHHGYAKEKEPLGLYKFTEKSVLCEWVSGDFWLQGQVIRMFSQSWLLVLWFFHHL